MYTKMVRHLRRLRLRYTKKNQELKKKGGRRTVGEGLPTYAELRGMEAQKEGEAQDAGFRAGMEMAVTAP